MVTNAMDKQAAIEEQIQNELEQAAEAWYDYGHQQFVDTVLLWRTDLDVDILWEIQFVSPDRTWGFYFSKSNPDDLYAIEHQAIVFPDMRKVVMSMTPQDIGEIDIY